jgi:alpha-L-rhamnosidase
MQWHAQWIWTDSPERRPRNQTVIARTRCDLPAAASATLAITADSQYRLFINGAWVADGPCRSWPAHFQYDLLDVRAHLQPGPNVLVVVARHFGVSTFHQLPQAAGLLVQLDVVGEDGVHTQVCSDAGWRIRESAAHLRETARTSIQMSQSEWYDATREFTGVTEPAYDDRAWPTARAYYPALAGPWRDLTPRDVPPLTRAPLLPARLLDAQVVGSAAKTITFDLKRLCYPDDYSANMVPLVGVLATSVVTECVQEIPLSFPHSEAVQLFCHGQRVTDGILRLTPGENLLTLTIAFPSTHQYDLSLGFQTWNGTRLTNPCDAKDPNPWAWIGPLLTMDRVTNHDHTTRAAPLPAEVLVRLAELAACPTPEELGARVGDAYRPSPIEVMHQRDHYLAFCSRRPLRLAPDLVHSPDALLTDADEWAVLAPPTDGDLELCLDFGRETVGWVEFDLLAPAGLVVDVNLIEYRDGDRLQIPQGNRNGFRYLAREGINHFVSLRRRAGRYLFLTLRAQRAPVRIRLVRLLEATYPVVPQGRFACSDPALARIWTLSADTLRLCMEDTYTDCPLYEQTLWVGDARNEALYNAILFGADDLTRRCLRLSAESLETLPLVGSQVPSGWNILLPAWSFLWGIGVWEYYWTSGDREGLESLYPAVLQNLRAAHAACTDRGLFSLPVWNLFDWAGIDDAHATVLHNSLFLLGALAAARRCGEALGAGDDAWLATWEADLRAALLAQWDPATGSYPDAIHADGLPSPSRSQHTSALALLNEALPAGAEAHAHQHLLTPPDAMVRIGSPFAMQFVLEALERVGDAASALALVRARWGAMVESGATTCWETFPGWESVFPTRSHCHAWSSAPVYVLARTVLGVVPAAPGSAEVIISPHPLDLAWADGAVASPHGPISVAWRREGTTLTLTIDAPPAVRWRVEPNADWTGVETVLVNGTPGTAAILAAPGATGFQPAR